MPADSSDPTLKTLQAKHAAAHRWPTPDKDQIARDYAGEKLAAYIKRTVDAAPPLTPAQRDKLALLLRGGDAA